MPNVIGVYVPFITSRDLTCRYDDSVVTPLPRPPAVIKSKSAYILFYERREISAPVPANHVNGGTRGNGNGNGTI